MKKCQKVYNQISKANRQKLQKNLKKITKVAAETKDYYLLSEVSRKVWTPFFPPEIHNARRQTK